MRNTFVQELVSLARQHPQIALIVGDLGYSVVEPFADEFPDRFINAGVAEQNMTGLAAGMASEGYHVFTYSIANFPTFRCAEQIRNDVDYHKLPVTVVTVGGGLAYGALGYSHHAVQDYALMRSFPNMLIAAPGDPMEVRACVRYLVKNPGPSYLRLGKAGEPNYHKAPPVLKPGEWVKMRDGISNKKKCLITTGATLDMAMCWTSESKKWSEFSVYSLPLWGMIYKQNQADQLACWDKVVSLEDHLIDAGFGSWLLESTQYQPDLAHILSIKALAPEVCGYVGSQTVLNIAGGLNP